MTNELLQRVRSKIVAKVPEILHIKAGCVVRNLWASVDNPNRDYVLVDTHKNYGKSVKTGQTVRVVPGNMPDGREPFEILGRPVTFADVLRAIDKNYRGDQFATVASNGWMHFGRERGFWNLVTDLDHQSPELLTFLDSILGDSY